MRLTSVPLVGTVIAAGGCCCCCGDFMEKLKVELEKQGVEMPVVPGVSEDGVNVTVDADGTEVHVETGPAKLEGPLAVFPMFEGAVMQAHTEVAGVSNAAFIVEDSDPTKVIDFYATSAKGAGWTEVARSTTGDMSVFQAEKDGATFSASATEQAGQLWLTLTLTPAM